MDVDIQDFDVGFTEIWSKLGFECGILTKLVVHPFYLIYPI
jgi:hypothetical protein